MFSSIAKAAGLVALLSTPSLAVALPAEVIARTPDVPWKRTGVSDVHRRQGYPTGCTNGPTSRDCWDGDFTVSTDQDISWPDTGKTVSYNLEIAPGKYSPDGVEKDMILINGQYPGPTIVADWGDTISITVKSSLTLNGTGIHWHGLRQLGSNQMDGVGGITECPIADGVSKTYTFKATQYGSSWYHSHYSVQYGDGVVGGIIINGPATANYDLDLGVLPFTDWFYAPIFTVNAASLHANGPPTADNVLVNGTMTSASGGQYSVTKLEHGKKHLLRLVNTGINNWIHVSLDQHPFTVVSSDFTPIVPFVTDSLVLAVGQRYDVIINANQTEGNYWLRVGTGGGRCDGPNTNAANIRGIFAYGNSTEPLDSANSTGITLPTGCDDETNIVPFVKTDIPQDTPEELTLGFTNTQAAGNLVQWLIDGVSLRVDLKDPTLLNVLNGNDTFEATENVYVVGEKNQWQYWVIQQNTSSPPIPHPIHLHGHDFYVLQQGTGEWAGDLSGLDLDNPPRRDTATLPAGGFLVLAFESDNPGAWLMHCHIPFHISQGLGLQFLERSDEIVSANGGLSGLKDGCATWGPYQDENFPNGFTYGDSLL
ncbi:multicopper oxidase [Lophiostoma macrostomum CBS 122681]|uniref:Multicopper oxidase n=1 Tax=Lophiostoma macrostomum CBS 122681 TaxID=1314788 RepID=A0A6A6TJM2_9PLEO|nr:multicopper oxidase [Lophiostoma macrostomum CBS 122681]